MTINYFGQLKDCKHNTRVAEISFTEKEEPIVRRIEDLALKTAGWKSWSFFDECVLISVDDRKDFLDFKDFYKEAKKMFTACAKYGF